MTAAKTLQRLGVSTKPVNIGGGILAWQAMGNPIDGVHAT
jgi:rhodanese-related sulfurtransferase